MDSHRRNVNACTSRARWSNGTVDRVPTSCHANDMPLPDDYDTNDNYHKGRGVDAPPLPAGFDCTPGGIKREPDRSFRNVVGWIGAWFVILSVLFLMLAPHRYYGEVWHWLIHL